MTHIFEMEKNIKEIIDQLKGVCSQNGLGNQAEVYLSTEKWSINYLKIGPL